MISSDHHMVIVINFSSLEKPEKKIQSCTILTPAAHHDCYDIPVPLNQLS